MKKIPLSEVKDDLSRYLREAEEEDVIITRHGKPAGILIGFESEDDWFDYRIERDPRFLRRIEAARADLRAGRGVRIGRLDKETDGSEQALAPDGASGGAGGRTAEKPPGARSTSVKRAKSKPRG